MRVLFSQPILLLLRNKTALPDCKGVVIVGDVGDKGGFSHRPPGACILMRRVEANKIAPLIMHRTL